MTITTRGQSGTAAKFLISGFISVAASWIEEYNFQVDGGVIDANAALWEWQFNFRSDYGDSPALSLSTVAGTITVTNGSDSTTIAINVPPDDLASLDGDYIADMAYENTDGDRIHWAHGIVSFRNEPIWSD